MKRRDLFKLLGLAPIVAGTKILGVEYIIPDVIPENSFAYSLKSVGLLEDMIEVLKEFSIDSSFLFISRDKNGRYHLKDYIDEHFDNNTEILKSLWNRQWSRDVRAYYGISQND